MRCILFLALLAFAGAPARAAIMKLTYWGTVSNVVTNEEGWNDGSYMFGQDLLGADVRYEVIYDSTVGHRQDGATDRLIGGKITRDRSPGLATSVTVAGVTQKVGVKQSTAVARVDRYKFLGAAIESDWGVIRAKPVLGKTIMRALVDGWAYSSLIPSAFDVSMARTVATGAMDLRLMDCTFIRLDYCQRQRWVHLDVDTTAIEIAPSAAPVPLPPALPFLAAGVVTLAGVRFRRRRS